MLLFFAVNSQAQTIYVTESGKKFHKKNCTVVKEGKKGLELAEAKKRATPPAVFANQINQWLQSRRKKLNNFF